MDTVAPNVIPAYGVFLDKLSSPPGSTVHSRVSSMTAMFAGFASLLTLQLGVSGSLSSLVAIILLAATAIETQLRLGAVIGFAIAVVWALIGVAAESMQQDSTVATAAVIAIAAMTTVLVRVTT